MTEQTVEQQLLSLFSRAGEEAYMMGPDHAMPVFRKYYEQIKKIIEDG